MIWKRQGGTGFITQSSWIFHFHQTIMVSWKCFVPQLYQLWRGISKGPALKYFYMIPRSGRWTWRAGCVDWGMQRGRGLHLSGASSNVNFLLQLAPQICAMYSVVFNKIDASYTVSIRPFVALCPHFFTKTCPLPLRWTGISRKGRFFPTDFRASYPKKNCVSIFFTTLLHCPGPLGTQFNFLLTPMRECVVDKLAGLGVLQSGRVFMVQ